MSSLRRSGIASMIPLKPTRRSLNWIGITPEAGTVVPQTYVKLETRTRVKTNRVIYFLIKFLFIWKWLVLVTILWNYMQTTYIYLVWRPVDQYHWLFYAAVAFDIVFAVDVCLTIATLSTLGKATTCSVLVVCFDALLAMPFWFLYTRLKNDTDGWYIALRFVCLLRLYHIVGYFWKQKQRVNLSYIKVFCLGFVLHLVLILHTGSCIWCALACPIGEETCGGWYTMFLQDETVTDNPIIWYSTALFYMGSSVLRYGYIFGLNSKEKIVIGLGLIYSYVFVAYYIANLFVNLVLQNERLIHLYTQLACLKEHCLRIDMKVNFTRNLTRSYNVAWVLKRGVVKVEMFRLLPKSMITNAAYDINLPAFKCTLVFRSAGEAYLRHLAALMKHEYYNTNDYIFRQAVSKEKLIIVVSGVIEVMSEEDDNSPILTFGPGTCLGESALVYNVKSKTSVRAGNFVEIQALYRDDFYSTIAFYPKQFNRVLRMIKGRTQEAYTKKLSEYPASTKVATIRRLRGMMELPVQGYFPSLYKEYKKPKISRYVQESSSLYMAWELLITALVLIVSFAYPYFIGFWRHFPKWFTYASVIIEFVFLVDIFVTLVTCKSQKTAAFLSVRSLMCDKFNSIEIYLDIFAAFYFELFCYLFDESDHYYYVFKLNRLVKVYRLVALFNKLEELFTINIITVHVAKFLTLFSIFSFWLCSASYMETCFGYVCTNDGWFKIKVALESGNLTETPIFESAPTFSVYFVLSYIVSFEMHEIFVRNSLDMILTIFVLLFGTVFLGYCVADLASVLYLEQAARFEFLRDIRLLREFCEHTRMSPRLQLRLVNYFWVQWWYNHCFDLKKRTHITAGTEEEMIINERIDCLKKVFIFANTDEGFLRAVALRSKVYLLPPGDIVTYYGSMNKEMFVVMTGYCVYKNYGGSYRRMGPGASFGMCSLFFSMCEVVIVRTLTHCKLITIDGSALQEALNLYPSMNSIVKDMYTEVHQSFVQETLLMPELTYFVNSSTSGTLFQLKWRDDFTKQSFVNMLQYCQKHKEVYSEPFTAIDTFFLMKYLLVPSVILPDGPFIYAWTAARLATAFLYVVFCPVQQIVSPYHTAIHWFLFILDLFSYVDLYLMLHTCYYDAAHSLLVLHPMKTAINYLHGPFFVDFFISLPYEVVVSLMTKDHGKEHSPSMHVSSHHLHHCMVRLVRMLHVYKIFVAFKNWEDNARLKRIFIHFIKYVTMTIIFANAWACLLMYHTCLYIDARDFDEKIHSKYYKYFKMNETNMYYKKQSWLDRSKYNDHFTIFDVYVTAFYWVVNTMMGLNFDDITVQGGTELAIAILILLFGVLFHSYVTFTTLPHCLETDFRVLKFKRRFSNLVAFMRHEKIDKHIKKKLIENAIYTWRRTRDVNITTLFSCLHTTLLQDTLSFLYEDTLRQVPLFSAMDRSFLRILAMVMRPQYFLEEQVIVEADDIIDVFYIIHRGTVSVELVRSTIKMDLIRGSLFGYYYNETVPIMTITAKAISNVDVLCVRTVDYYNILKNYSKFNYKIKQVLSEFKDFMPNKNDKNTMNILICKRETTQDHKSLALIHRILVVLFVENERLFHYIDFVVLVAAYMNSVIHVAQFAFQTDYFFECNIAVDTIFILRLFTNFFRPYYDNYGELVTNRNMIKKRYLKNKSLAVIDFFINIYACMMYFMFHTALKFGHSFFCYSLLYLLTCIRVIYIVQYFRQRWGFIDVGQVKLKLLWLLLWTTLIIHYCAITWYMIVCPFNDCKDHEGKSSSYVSACFFVINVMTGTAMIEVNMKTTGQKVFVITMAICLRFLMVIVIASLINILWYFIRATLKYEYQLREFQDYMRCANINKYQVKKMVQYLKSLWHNEHGQPLPELFHKIPSPVINEVKIAMYKPLLIKSYLFNNTEDLFLRNVALLLEHTVYFAGNFIVYDGQIDEKMYFIKSGEVEIVTINSNLIETVHDVLHETEMFGLAQGLFNSVPHQFTFRARERCEILTLQLEQWEHLLAFYEKSKELIYKRIKNLHMQLNK